MTPDEVQRALHGEAKNQILPEFARDKWNLNIANVKIQADNDVLNMDVHFLFDKSEKLPGVTMVLAPSDRGLILTDIPFDYFEKQLSAKYGPPTFQKTPDITSDQQIHQLVWNLRFTTVTLDQLRFVNSSNWGANMFSVFYEPTRRTDVP